MKVRTIINWAWEFGYLTIVPVIQNRNKKLQQFLSEINSKIYVVSVLLFFFKYLIAWGVNEQLMDPMALLNSVFIIVVDSYVTHLILEAYGIALCVLLN